MQSVSNTSLHRFSRYLFLSVAIFLVLCVAFACYVVSEKRIDKANAQRLDSFLLATELRQSSDRLTILARSYVMTGDVALKQNYHEVLDMRDGRVPRADALLNMHGVHAAQAEGQRIPLLRLMESAGIGGGELALLRQAKAQSDALAQVETSVMDMVEVAGVDDALRLRAARLLFGPDYMQAKTGIQASIREFERLMDARTHEDVSRQQMLANAMRAAFVVLGALLLLSLRLTYRSLQHTLGGSLEDVHARIVRIGSGDFAATDAGSADPPAGSVLAWLAQTRQDLMRLDADRRSVEEGNRRLSRLYTALSECNDAILHAAGEDEMFARICREMVVHGGMQMAWMGTVDARAQRIRIIAASGSGIEYQQNLFISTDSSLPEGRGPSGVAVREDRPYWCADFEHDPATLPWRDRAARYGWKASAALPLHRGGDVIGVLTVYWSQRDVLDSSTRSLLQKLAYNLDYALNGFEQDRQRRQALAELAQSKSLLQTIIDTAPVRIFWKDAAARYLGCNPLFARDAGAADATELLGKRDDELPWKDKMRNLSAEERLVLESGAPRLFHDEEFPAADGATRWVRSSRVPLHGPEGDLIGVLGVYEDITEQKRAQERIEFLANYDALTGLPSRSRLDDHLHYALSNARRGNGRLALMFLDLDHFKDVNDGLGHSVGDAMLVELARRLRAAVRQEDTVARLGGDEFILLLPGADADGAARVAQKLLDAIAEPFAIERYKLDASASIGIALYPDDGADLESLSRSADTAMYHAKREGRRDFRFATPAMQARSARNLELLSAMKRSLELGQFEVVYQPLYSLREERVIGAEALLRWTHPEFGPVPPGEFIPLAEDSGVIMPLGEMVLRESARQARLVNDAGFGPFAVAVNLSAVQFRQPDLPALVERILREEGLPPDALELELTESAAMSNPQHAVSVMDALRRRGIRMAIDDFGTGYSSLAYLKRFKAHKIKIDQSFVRDILSDPEDRAIVSAIVQMARTLGMRTIAEGVESGEQLAYLREQGCDEIQGYYHSRALGAEALNAFLRQRQMRLS